jgi:hypothetical protein
MSWVWGVDQEGRGGGECMEAWWWVVDGVWGDGVAGTDTLGAAEHGVNFQKKLRTSIVKS